MTGVTNYVTVTNANEPGTANAIVKAVPSVSNLQSFDVEFAPSGFTTTTNSSGVFSIPLLPTDSTQVNSPGWYWEITVEPTAGIAALAYTFWLSALNGATQDLSTLTTNNNAPAALASQGYVAAAVLGETTRAETVEATKASLTIANTFTADQYFKSGRPWFDVIAFGADPTGATDSTTAIQNAINAATGSADPSTNTRQPTGPVFLPAGTYKVSSDIIIRSVSGFRLMGAGINQTTICASGTGFTQAVLFIDGSVDGIYEGFQINGNGTEGAGGAGIPDGIRLDWTTAASRSTSGNKFADIRVRNLNFVTGLSLEGTGTRQLDGTLLQNVLVAGQQTGGAWSSTGNWLVGIAFGNGSQGNNYDHACYGSSGGACYIGHKVYASSAAFYGLQPNSNGTDFWLEANDQTTILNCQSQNAGQFIVAPTGSLAPVSVRDCSFKGWTGAGYNNVWISIGTSYGNWVFDNVAYKSSLTSPAPVIDLGSANYKACFTLINVSQPNPPSTGIVPGNSSTPAFCVNYQDTTSGRGPSAVQYPFYAVNAGVLYQQNTFASQPAASTYGEGFYYATDTGALYHSNGSAWTNLAITPTVPQVNWYTTTGANTWTKPANAQIVSVLLGSGAAGGGSGALEASGTAASGGGGGGGGGLISRQFLASQLTSSVTISVGAGGLGGVAQTTNSTTGNNGLSGGTTFFGNYLSAFPGGAGGGGGTSTGGGAGTGYGPQSGSNGGAGGAAGAAGVGSGAAVGGGGSGGGGGGGVTAGGTANNGGIANYTVGGSTSNTATGGVVGGAAPGTGTQPSVDGTPSCGGGGGAGSATGNGQTGATPYFCGGGGGGGGALNGNSSGAGGQGGQGFALVITFFQ